MMKQEIRIKRWLKRICAGALVAAMTVPSMLSSAASAYYIRFYDSAIAKEYENTTIVEGSSINIRAKLPPRYEFSVSTPFAVRQSGVGSITDVDKIFNIQKNSDTNYTLIAKQGSASALGKTSEEYTLNAIYTAILSEGTGSGTYENKAENVFEQFALRVVADPEVGITEDSALSFTATSDESNGMVGFGPVTATNGFADYNGGTINDGTLRSDSTGRYISMRIPSQNAENPQALVLRAYLQGVSSDYVIKKGTKFSISFLRQTINSMILTVVTPQKAVDDTISSVQQNPTDPEATVKNQPYIKLSPNETLTSIKTNFTLLTQVHRHNVDVTLDWKWVPADEKYKDIVNIKPNTPSLSSFEILDRPKEDVKGALRVTASYGTASSAPIDIPIVIYGTGVPPSITPMMQQIGNPNADGEPNPKEEKIDAMPSQMDVYRGNANFAAYPDAPKGPFSYRLSLDFGVGRGAAQTMKITYLGDGGDVDIVIDNNINYKMGDTLTNPGYAQSLEVTAKTPGQIRLQFEFYNSNNEAMKSDWVVWKSYIFDSNPSTNGTLESMPLRVWGSNDVDQGILNEIYPKPVGVVDYGFTALVNTYAINVPNKATSIDLTPRIPTGTGAHKDIVVNYDGKDYVVESGKSTEKIPLEEQRAKTITFTVTAQDGSTNIYTLNVTRTGKNNEATLKSMTAMKTTADATDLITNFSPTVFEYAVTVPYSVSELSVGAAPTSPWASVGIDGKTPAVAREHKKTVPLSCEFDLETGTVKNNVTEVRTLVVAEDGATQNEYVLRITREPPSDVRTLTALSVSDAEGNVFAFESNQTFTPGQLDYYVTIPYATKELMITAKPEDPRATNVVLTRPDVYGGGDETRTYANEVPVVFKGLDVSQELVQNEKKDLFTYSVRAIAESGRKTDPPYTLTVRRTPPSSDNTLNNLLVMDEKSVPVPGYTFRSHLLEYDISVPYLCSTVEVKPEVATKLSTVTVNREPITEKNPSGFIKLEVGKTELVEVDVTAENGEIRNYILRIKREAPSSEARLSNLQVDGQTIKPAFVPSKTEYTASLPQTVQEYSITAKSIDPYATITIDGKKVESGASFKMPVPTTVETVTEIVVTAQDGKTKMTYTLTVLAEALVEKSDNADLKSLEIKVGELSPEFKPGIWEYDVAVKPGTASVDIFATPENQFATMEIKSGSKILGDYNNNYSTALTSNLTDLTVSVTAQDGETKREYKLKVYRETDGKEGSYEVITADMVDFETHDPIVVDITVYSMVAADVFNTMKDEYPDKTIIFKGNDYSLECKGSDIKQHVPNTEIFDFSMSFTSPLREKIESLLGRLGNPVDLNPVYVAFGHHGPLPASMKLTVSLGSVYGNQSLCWNYYNEERDRIDYYGNVSSNGQGTFSLRMSHMSTYLVTTRAIIGAENKVGLESGVSSENLSSDVTTGKRNPSTFATQENE